MADGSPPPQGPGAPCNIEAEQALLGALLVCNEALHRVAALVSEADFFEPLHGRIYAQAAAMIQKGGEASPVTLKPLFIADPSMHDVGGVGYLVRLMGAAVSIVSAPDYARAVREMADRRRLIAIGEDMAARAAEISPDTDAGALILDAETALQALRADEATGPITMTRIASDLCADLSLSWSTGERRRGLSWGLRGLDDLTGGMWPGQLIIMAGRPGMGKSAAALFTSFQAARRGSGVMFASLEMSGEEIGVRLTALQAWMTDPSRWVSYSAIRTADVEDEGARRAIVHAANAMATAPLIVTEANDLSRIVSEARDRARRWADTGHPLRLLVVDYLGKVRAPRDLRNRVQEIGEITGALKALAKELRIPVICLAQLNRATEGREDKRPTLADLRDSGEIEQDADVVVFPFREEYYVARDVAWQERDADQWHAAMERVRHRTEFIIAKQRQGDTGVAKAFSAMGINAYGDPQ